ncbi:aminotransferase class IV [Galbitalea soli]|uniref:Aminotransferase class IV n=1 Tax=Galbitalea soli TaxID=1268042 RepID=A0A7C9PL46_9MICO|nr:aminotransferase class IV [Galbitalea soli]NEM89828.1 aminotransferase class IV [Galbitalea soli]NYJ30532.1 hypothetical protein [Galbitalea soli]
MSVESIHRWHGGELHPLDYCDMTETSIAAADSWFVTEGTALALGLHRERFLAAVTEAVTEAAATEAGGEAGDAVEPHLALAALNPVGFWDASRAVIPRTGDWFPRVELQHRAAGGWLLVLRLRSAPERSRSVVVASWGGEDPRTHPRRKGPDLAAMLALRTAVQPAGAGEAVILTPEGFVVEGAYSALLWWRGEILCRPLDEFERVDSVTARSVLALAAALGVETFAEAVTPAELAGTELWSLSALHGIRIVTAWVDGPALAELPGRLSTWRARLDALRKPL